MQKSPAVRQHVVRHACTRVFENDASVQSPVDIEEV